jgi:hypothetical protein
MATRQDPRALEDVAYAWVLWIFWNLQLIERQDAALRAGEREELVYGIAYAYHQPNQLDRWRYDLRKNAGLLEKAESAVDRAKRFARMLGAQKDPWQNLDDPATEGDS